MLNIPNVTLNDGRQMPSLGLGVLKIGNAETAAIVSGAIKSGYRAFDTAAIYGNEQGVGEGMRQSGVARADIFVTTKLWNTDHGDPRGAFEKSLKLLGLDTIDLYLIHWPVASVGKYVDVWRALCDFKKEGRAKSIGVSNFTEAQITRLMDETGVAPAVNQIELHPYFQQPQLRAFHAKSRIITECWYPLGKGLVLDDPVIGKLAKARGKSPAQIILRWHVQHGFMVIPKSSNPARIVENAQVFDFTLDANEMAAIAALDRPDGRFGPKAL